jgi:endonuclease YncB( thermonuclease family)
MIHRIRGERHSRVSSCWELKWKFQHKEDTMRKSLSIGGFLLCLVLLAGPHPAFGKSLSGRVTEVKSTEVVVLNYGAGRYDVRIVGIDAPKEGPLAEQAKQFVANMVLGKQVRIRFEGRATNGEMVSRLFTGDPGVDVGVELLKAGMARRQDGYDYKYGELSAAEKTAREGRRGLWSTAQPN